MKLAAQSPPFADYLAIDAVNWSLLRELRKSPKHYHHRATEPREDADVLRLGRAAHAAVFEPERFTVDYTVWTEGRRAGKAWDQFETAALARGVTVLTAAQYEKACRIRNAVNAHPVAAAYLRSAGEAERTITWTDPKTKRACKARLDWVTQQSIVDLKTSRSIVERQFATAVATYGYHCQLAFYRAGWKAVTGQELAAILIAVESEPPHDVAVFRLDDDALTAGAEEVAELLDKLKDCESAGQFPGRYPREVELQLPRWCFPDDEEVEDSAGVKWLMGEEG